MFAVTAPYIPISNPGGQKVFPELPADILWNQTKTSSNSQIFNSSFSFFLLFLGLFDILKASWTFSQYNSLVQITGFSYRTKGTLVIAKDKAAAAADLLGGTTHTAAHWMISSKLSYVKKLHKKVTRTANLYWVIPKGRKFFVWLVVVLGSLSW